MNELDQTMYNAFFDELGRLEKAGMLSKFAVAPGLFSQLYRGGRQILTRPGHAFKAIQKAYGRGSLLQEASGGGSLRRLGGGLKEVWRTPQGKAAIVGGLGATGAVGGTGYLLGRGGNNQNVYVR